MALIDRLPAVYEQRVQHEERIRQAPRHPEYDKTGAASVGEISSLRFLGVAEFVLKADKASFRKKLLRAAEIKLCLLERYERGEPIDESYVTMLCYQDVLNALAAGGVVLAKSLASHMGGRPDLERQHDHPFDYAMGYALRAFVLGERTEMERSARDFDIVCAEKGNADFRGYTDVFNAILRGDTDLANAGLKQVVKGHKNQSRAGGAFRNKEDEVLCVWGIGMGNLCVTYALVVEGIPPLIAPSLLTE